MTRIMEHVPVVEGEVIVPPCNFFWGSHGCDLDLGDHRLHRCGADDPDGPCCEYDEDAPEYRRVRFYVYGDAEGEWDEWRSYGEGWRQ